MASPNPNPNNIPGSSFDPTTSAANTTFVQADPTTFRAVVQRLTGANPDTISPRRPAFKLQDRRQLSRNLHIKLNNGYGSFTPGSGTTNSPSSRQQRSTLRGFNSEMLMASPVSPLDLFSRNNNSPKTPMSPLEEEEKAIAEKGFYFHPSPLSTPRGSGSAPAPEPELLPLFPLHSPRD